jgi:hypothetical protein
MTEKISKHRDDLENAKQIMSVFPDYIPPLASAVSCDSVPCGFEYILIMAYLPKGICIVGPQLGLILALKISDFNLGYKNNYAILTPHHYLMKMTGKKPKIFPQLWIKEIARSMIVITLKCTTQAYLASGQLMPLPSQSHAEQNLKKPLKSSNPRPKISLGVVDCLLALYCTRVTTG